jgi:tetratricopeptide (TPR) repeat protein
VNGVTGYLADPWDPASYTRALVSLEWASRLRPEVEDLSPLAGPIASGLLANAAWLAPAQAAPHLNLAAHFLISGDPEGAVASYRRALELRPELVASVLRQVSDFAPDPGWLDRIVPDGPEAQLLYGEFLAERGSVERAEVAYGASLRGGATPRAVLRLHDLYLGSCRAPHGVSLVRRALERGVAKSGVEQAELYYALARSLIRLQDPEGAASSLERAAQSAPDRLLYQHALAELIAGEQPAEAIRRWEGLLHRRRASPEMTQLRADIYLGLARAYEREGRTLEALRGYRRVLVDRPDDASVLGRITLLQRGER